MSLGIDVLGIGSQREERSQHSVAYWYGAPAVFRGRREYCTRPIFETIGAMRGHLRCRTREHRLLKNFPTRASRITPPVGITLLRIPHIIRPGDALASFQATSSLSDL